MDANAPVRQSKRPKRKRRSQVVRGRVQPTEAEFTRSVVKLLRLHGWRVAHHPDSRRLEGDKGLPDILAVHGRRGSLLAVELKVGYNKPTPEQAAWLAELEAAGAVVAVLKPQDWKRLEELARGEDG